jgi:uncharacterized membrane protein YuzA (DUF378 family)
MKTIATVAQMAVRACFVIMIVLGVLFWTGRAYSLLPLHEFLGFVLVLSLWTLAGLAASRHVPVGVVVIAFLWGLLLPVFGLTQAQIFPGSFHWIVQILHLLVGLAAVGQAENLARRIKVDAAPAAVRYAPIA